MIPPDGESAPASSTAPPNSPPAPAGSGGPLGTGTFTIEGRTAPALFVLGWLATIVGGGVLFVSLQTGAGAAKFVLFVVGMALLSLGLVSAAGSQAIERRARGVRPYWGPSPILLFLACIPTAALPLILLGVPLQLAGVDIDGPPVAVLALLVQAAVYVLLIRLVVVDTGALSWSEMRIRRPSVASFGELGYGAVWALPIIFVTGLISFVLVSAFGVTPDSPLRGHRCRQRGMRGIQFGLGHGDAVLTAGQVSGEGRVECVQILVHGGADLPCRANRKDEQRDDGRDAPADQGPDRLSQIRSR